MTARRLLALMVAAAGLTAVASRVGAADNAKGVDGTAPFNDVPLARAVLGMLRPFGDFVAVGTTTYGNFRFSEKFPSTEPVPAGGTVQGITSYTVSDRFFTRETAWPVRLAEPAPNR